MRRSEEWRRAVDRQVAKFDTRIGPKSAERLARLLAPAPDKKESEKT